MHCSLEELHPVQSKFPNCNKILDSAHLKILPTLCCLREKELDCFDELVLTLVVNSVQMLSYKHASKRCSLSEFIMRFAEKK